MKKMTTGLISVAGALAIALGVSIYSGAVGSPAVNTSDVGLYTYFFGHLQAPGTQFQYDQNILVSPSDTNYLETWSCPSVSTDVYTFMTDHGSEHDPTAWKSFNEIGFASGQDNQVTNLKPAGLINGIAQNIKRSGGDYSLGIACTSNNGTVVDKTGYLFVTVTPVTGVWTAEAPPITGNTPSATPTQTPTATPAVFTAPLTTPNTPAWLINSTIYQANVRSFSQRGDFTGFAEQIPRLKALGVKIINFLPVTPISQTKKIGLKGLVDASDDNTAINPDLGSAADFTNLVQQLHDNKMRVVVSWQAAGVGWDNPWLSSHKDFFLQDGSGNPVQPTTLDRSDLAGFDFTQIAMQLAQIKAMKTWITKYGVDGFYALNATAVPSSFWDHAVAEVGDNANIAWLADSQSATLTQHAFASMANEGLMLSLAKLGSSKLSAAALVSAIQAGSQESFGSTIALNYTSSDFQNVYSSNFAKKFGSAANEALAIQFLTPGIPSIYMGQEVGSTVRLPQGSQLPISKWNVNNNSTKLVGALIRMRTNNSSLSSTTSSTFSLLSSSSKTSVAFARKTVQNYILGVFNLSSSKATVTFKPTAKGSYFDFLSGKKITLGTSGKVSLPGYGFVIYTQVK